MLASGGFLHHVKEILREWEGTISPLNYLCSCLLCLLSLSVSIHTGNGSIAIKGLEPSPMIVCTINVINNI